MLLRINESIYDDWKESVYYIDGERTDYSMYTRTLSNGTEITVEPNMGHNGRRTGFEFYDYKIYVDGRLVEEGFEDEDEAMEFADEMIEDGDFDESLKRGYRESIKRRRRNRR